MAEASNMGTVGKLERDIEIKSPAEKFYHIFRCQCHNIPESTEKIHSIDVHEGDWEKPGSVKLWKYNLEGKVETFKEKVEVHDENKAVTFIAVGGDVLEHFKSYKGTFKFTQNGEVALAKITLDYEKRKEDDPDPCSKYMDFLVALVEDIDAQILKGMASSAEVQQP